MKIKNYEKCEELEITMRISRSVDLLERKLEEFSQENLKLKLKINRLMNETRKPKT